MGDSPPSCGQTGQWFRRRISRRRLPELLLEREPAFLRGG
jgi:hypothetical protein